MKGKGEHLWSSSAPAEDSRAHTHRQRRHTHTHPLQAFHFVLQSADLSGEVSALLMVSESPDTEPQYKRVVSEKPITLLHAASDIRQSSIRLQLTDSPVLLAHRICDNPMTLRQQNQTLCVEREG